MFNEIPETQEGIKNQIEGMTRIYDEAYLKKDYRLCDKIRLELLRVVSGKPLLIRIEEGLNLPKF